MNKQNIILKITDKYGKNYYGGDQDWYSSNTRAMGGCSSVSAANLLRALCRTNRSCFVTIKKSQCMPVQIKRALISSTCDKNDFLMLMTGVYETMKAYEIYPLNKIYDHCARNSKPFTIIKPNTGRSSIGFIQGTLRFAQKIGLLLKYAALPTAFVCKDDALEFIRKGLSESGSVVLLTSYNKHSLKTYASSYTDTILSSAGDCPCCNSSMKCHFATITGITETELIITTWGKIATVNIDELISSWKSIKAWESALFYFTPAKNKSEMIKSLISSPLPFFKGILQTIIRKAVR